MIIGLSIILLLVLFLPTSARPLPCFLFLEKASRFFFVRCLFKEANLFSLRGCRLYVANRALLRLS